MICEAENDFWPNSRHFYSVGEHRLAFEGLYLYLLERDDIWKKNHALIKSIKKSWGNDLDFEELEISVLDNGIYDEQLSVLEWRAKAVQYLEEKSRSEQAR